MRPIRIAIENPPDTLLNRARIQYVFRTLFDSVSLPHEFVDGETVEKPDVWYGSAPRKDCRVSIRRCPVPSNSVPEPIEVLRGDDSSAFFRFLPDDPRDRHTDWSNGTLVIRNDIVLSAFYLLSGWHERATQRDRHGRPIVESSLLYRSRLLHDPPVNRYALMLFHALADASPQPPWPDQKQFALALSHDVDYPVMNRPIEAIRHALEHGLRGMLRVPRILAGRESYWRFREWVALERDYGYRSAFYFCGLAGSLLRYFLIAPDPFYDVLESGFPEVIRELDDEGFEVGLHASYWAHRSTCAISHEKRRLEMALGKPVRGNRHHYWHVDPERPAVSSLRRFEAGLDYDCSVCNEYRAGFRFGICTPFHLYDPVTDRCSGELQVPTALMDNHLFQYRSISYFDDTDREIEALLDAVRKYHGVLGVDYHVRVLNDTFYPGWGESYRSLLRKVYETGCACCATPAELADVWRRKNSELRRPVQDEYAAAHR